MFSRIAKVTSVRPSLLYRMVSTSSSSSNATQAVSNEVRRYPHDAPERDFVNFPPVRQPIYSKKVRLGFIPDDWFQFMYNKTGVSGPYVILWGGLISLLSKEIFIPWVDNLELLTFIGVAIAGSKLYGKQIGEHFDKIAKEHDDAFLNELKDSTKHIDEEIATNELLKSLPEANTLIHEAKRENIHLQIEAAFRHRVAQIHQEVKRRLDYQVALQNVHRRVEKEQAINYILDGVHKSIGPNQEKEAFQSGLNQLKQLSQKYAATI